PAKKGGLVRQWAGRGASARRWRSSRIPSFRRATAFTDFRVSPLGSVNPSPLGDWDGTLRVCKMRSPEVHTIWDCKYHIVWITKYRFPVLGGDVGQRARELLREIARAHEMTIYAGAINRDHVHMLIGIPPHLSVSRAVQFLKGK